MSNPIVVRPSQSSVVFLPLFTTFFILIKVGFLLIGECQNVVSIN